MHQHGLDCRRRQQRDHRGGAVPSVTNTATVTAAGDFSTANNSASDLTSVVNPPARAARATRAADSPGDAVGVLHPAECRPAGDRIGPGLFQVTLTANIAPGLTSNGLTSVTILQATNAVVDGLGTQSNRVNGQVSLANVPSTTFTVRRLAAGAFIVHIEVTDACGVWKTFVGGGGGVQ